MRPQYNLEPLNKAIKRFAAYPKIEANQTALLDQIAALSDQQQAYFDEALRAIGEKEGLDEDEIAELSVDEELSPENIELIRGSIIQAFRESSLKDYSEKPGFMDQLPLLYRNLRRQDAQYKAENFEDEESLPYLLGKPSLVLGESLGLFIILANEMKLEPVVESKSRLPLMLKIFLGALLVSMTLALALFAALVAAPALIPLMGLAGTAVGLGLAAIAASQLAITVTALSAFTATLFALAAVVPFAAARFEMTMLGFVNKALSNMFGRGVASKAAASDENLTAIAAPKRFITEAAKRDSANSLGPASHVSSESAVQPPASDDLPPSGARPT